MRNPSDGNNRLHFALIRPTLRHMKLAWLTDIHLNFLRPAALEAFLASLADTEADAFLPWPGSHTSWC
jgi:hypothetical protein